MVNSAFSAQVAAKIPLQGFQVAGVTETPAYADLLSLIQSQGATTIEACSEIVTTLMELSQSQDLQTEIILRSLAEGVEWPEYDGGDGYWAEPSNNSVKLVRIGRHLQSHQVELANSILNSGLPGVRFLAIGIAKNPNLPRDVILTLGNFSDPVIVTATDHPSLTAADVRSLLDQVNDGEWVADFVLGNDGWRWPDWQDAFGVYSGCPDSPAFWQVAFSEFVNPDPCAWFKDFLFAVQATPIDQDRGDFWMTFEGLQTAMMNQPDLIPLALATAWPPAIITAATEIDDTEIMRELAVSEIPHVRQSIINNENATDEIRALAAMGIQEH